MENLLEYSQYKQLLCIYVDGDGSIHILQSSNRAISIQKIKEISGYSAVSGSMDLFVQDLFSKYFELQLEAHLSDPQLLLQSTIVDYFKDLKHTMLKESEGLLKESQLVFVMPIGWEGETYQNNIRTLFLQAGWITQEDGKYKLVIAPFIEVLVDYLKKDVLCDTGFIREGKYMLCYLRSGHKYNEILFNTICFQMQSAKEMIAISKTLASSNFMLVPTIKSSVTVRLSDTDQIVRNVVEQLLCENKPSQATQDVMQVGKRRKRSRLSSLIKRPFKSHHHASQEAILKELADATMSELSSIYKSYNYRIDDEPLSRDDDNSKLKKKGFDEYLSGLTCGRLITEIWDDANVKQFIEQVSEIITRMLEQHGTVEGSPDGIQDVILCKFNPRIKSASCKIIEEPLSKRILQYGSYLTDMPRALEVCKSAMIRPIKMIQIANAMLPPIIVDQQDTDDTLSSLHTASNALIAPNTYYAQVRIGQQHIDVILNKVIKVSALEDAVQKFTALEKRIEMPSIMEITLENMWNHYQSLDPNVLYASLLRKCSQNHSDEEMSLRNYDAFKFSLQKMMKIWFSDTSPVAKEEPDSYQLVSIDGTCDCALRISHRMLLEVGLRPAIMKMAAMIVGTLISNDSFGLYYVPTIIITTGSILENLFFSYHLEQYLKESVQNCFYVHQRKPTLHFYNESKQAKSQLTHYLGRGSYSQLSSTSYFVKISRLDNSDGGLLVGVQEEDANFCTSLESEGQKRDSLYEFFNYHFTAQQSLLKKGEVLGPKGISKTIQTGSSCNIAIFALDTTLNKTQAWRCIWSEGRSWGYRVSYPVTITIIPQNHISTVQIGFSYLSEEYVDDIVKYRLVDIKESVNIHERLHLKASS